ncbi:signal peptide-containing protein [Theileria equi strain WA]|uniref:Signal peptide-containing protein n=1 Tax=Theileria equi strain WA TaxID=1537102 RepID=L0B140_THEEQ|nr:signal peptide-containing protein [Theileria equi strain WA]AFZ80946.1 signal peptide-containing protein [Theileria equi strain WA]|eukprot:XP_004830612.1 signal peptide-containing protein [Theileria equi strain WA]
MKAFLFVLVVARLGSAGDQDKTPGAKLRQPIASQGRDVTQEVVNAVKRLEELKLRLDENVIESTKHEVVALVEKLRSDFDYRGVPQWPGDLYLNEFTKLIQEAEKKKKENSGKLEEARKAREALSQELIERNNFALNLQHGLEQFLKQDLTVDRTKLNLDAVAFPDEEEERDAVSADLVATKARLEELRQFIDEEMVDEVKYEVLVSVATLRLNPEYRTRKEWPGDGYLDTFVDLVRKAEAKKREKEKPAPTTPKNPEEPKKQQEKKADSFYMSGISLSMLALALAVALRI